MNIEFIKASLVIALSTVIIALFLFLSLLAAGNYIYDATFIGVKDASQPMQHDECADGRNDDGRIGKEKGDNHNGTYIIT